jgi:nitrogen fixation-related uncharacterized protein
LSEVKQIVSKYCSFSKVMFWNLKNFGKKIVTLKCDFWNSIFGGIFIFSNTTIWIIESTLRFLWVWYQLRSQKSIFLSILVYQTNICFVSFVLYFWLQLVVRFFFLFWNNQTFLHGFIYPFSILNGVSISLMYYVYVWNIIWKGNHQQYNDEAAKNLNIFFWQKNWIS